MCWKDTTVQTLANAIAPGNAFTFTLNGAIGGSGGFVKLVANSTVVLGTANNYAGDTQINAGTLAFTADNQLGAATSRLRMNGGTLQYNGASALALSRNIIVTANSTLDTGSGAGGSVNFSGALVGAANLTKIGANAATISGSNPWFFGTLNLGDGSATGGTTFASTGELRRANVVVASNAALTLPVPDGFFTREFAALDLAAGSTLTLGINARATIGFGNTNMTWAGTVVGGGTVTKVGTGTLTFTSNSGGTFLSSINVMRGGLTLSSNGALPQSLPRFTIGGWGDSANKGTTLLLDNSTVDVASRIEDTQELDANAAEIQFTTNGTTASSETIGRLNGAGMTTVTLATGGTLNFADASNGLTRVDRGTFLFRNAASTLGTGAASTTVGNLIFGNSGSLGLVGGGGGSGSTTISILPYAAGGITASDAGSNFVTYGANGIRVLNTTNEVQPDLFSAGATENVRTANPFLSTTTLGADKTINALNLAGTANRTRIESTTTEKLILTSGLLLNTVANVWAADATGTAGVPLGVQTAELRAGASNNSELHVFAAADLALGAKITTNGGGLTKSGAGTLFLTNATNTYTGPTAVNAGTLVIDSLSALGGSTSLLIGGGFLRYRGTDATLTGIMVKATGGRSVFLGASAGIDVTSGVTLTLPAGSVSSSNGGILKTGTGVLKLEGANTNSGPTIIAGGALAIGSAAALGGNPRVVFSTGSSTSGGQTLRFDAPMSLSQDFITNTSDAGVGFGFDTNGNDVTLSGTIASTTSTRGLFKIGAGNLTLTAAEMFTGAAQVYGGTLTLAGANGSIVPSASTGGYFNAGSTLLIGGVSLVLDNTSANNNNRLPDVWDSPFGSGDSPNGLIYMAGAELKVRGNASVATSERVNRVNLQVGTITLENNGQNATLTTGQFFRQNAQTTGLIRGTNLGATPSATSTNLFFTDLGAGSTQLGGARGAEGTPYVGILIGIVGDTSATGVGTELTTYAADTGVRLLDPGEYTSTIPAGNYDTSRAPNIALNGAASVGTQTMVSALKLGAGASVNGGGALTLTASTVFATGNASINTPVLRAENNAGYSFITAGAGTTLTINSALNGTTFFKYGDGTLALTNAYFASGASSIVAGQGTLLLSGANGGLTPLGAQVFVLKGATLDLGGMDRTIAFLGNLGFLGSAQGGGQIASEGTIALGANRLTLYDSTAFNWPGTITGGGGLTKGLFSTGASTFTQPLAFTGSTIIHAGALTLTGSATLASTQIDVRGGQLAFDNRDDFAFAGGYVANRVPTNGTINLAGTISFNENVNTPGVHNLGAVNLIGGGAIVVTQNTVAAPSTTTIANLTRAASKGTLTLNATNLGLVQAANGNARIFATQIDGAAPASALIGGGGAAGSSTVSIVPWAWSNNPASFVTYGADGFRPLSVTQEYSTDLSVATPATNVRLPAGQLLTGPATANSLIIGGGVSATPFGANLTLTSGALAFTTAGSSSVGNGLGDHLFTGNSDANELLINVTASNGALAMLYTLQGSGGLTKFGQGILSFTSQSPNNSFTGGIRIHEGLVQYTSDAQLGAAANAITFGGNTSSLTARGLEYNGMAKIVDLNRNIVLNGFGALSVTNGIVMRINGTISGAGALGFSRSTAIGIYEIDGTNTATGDIFLNQGYLAIRSDADLGAGSAVQLFNANANEGLVLRGDWTTSKMLHMRSSASVNTNAHDATINGLVIGSNVLTKLGAGTLTLTAPNPYSANLTVSAGSVVLKDRGAIGGGTPVVNSGYALVLDDTGTQFPDRIPNASSLTVTGGELALKGSSSAASEEVITGLTLSAGSASAVTLTPGSGQAAILRLLGTFTVNAGSTVFRGTNLGVNTPGTTNSATVIMAESSTTQQSGLVNMTFLTGGAAAAGGPSVSIIKGAFGDTSATGLGTQLVTYDLDKGVRLLTASEYTGTLVDGSVTTDNVRANGTNIGLTAATTANALWLSSGGTINTANPLTLTSGTVLATGMGNSITGSITSGGTNPIVIGGPGDLTLNNSIPSSTTGGLIKQGAGTLTLKTANSYTGQTVLAGGVVNIEATTSFNATAVRFQGGELRNTSGAPITIANAFTVEGAGIAGGADMKVGGAQDIDFQGNFTLANSNKTIEVTNTGTTTISGVISGTARVPGIGITKTGAGTLVLSGANTFGSTGDASFYESKLTLSAGIVSIPTIQNGGFISPLGATPSDADHLVFDGGTLRYTGPTASTDRLFTITPNGGTLDAHGAGALSLLNTGSIIASGTGARTFTLDGVAGQINAIFPKFADGATGADKLSVSFNAATWQTSTAHTFTGTAAINGGGTLQLVGSASLGANVIAINTGSFFNVTGLSGGASFDGTRFQITSGQTLRGDGTLLGGLHTLAGSTLDIGAASPAAAEQLTLSTPTTSSYDFDGTFTLDLWQNQAGLTASEGDRAVFTTSGASTVALGGTLQLRLGAGSGLDSLTFAEGDQWQLFNWGTLGVSGSFTSYDLPQTAPGRGWDVSQLASTGVIVIIPEPGVASLTLLGLGVLAARRRRR